MEEMGYFCNLGGFWHTPLGGPETSVLLLSDAKSVSDLSYATFNVAYWHFSEQNSLLKKNGDYWQLYRLYNSVTVRFESVIKGGVLMIFENKR